ncbi:MAG: hypothetical protein ACLVHS_13060 [Blautia wexlerae]
MLTLRLLMQAKIVTIEITGTGANAGFVTTIAGVEIKSFDVSNVTMNLGGESLSYIRKTVSPLLMNKLKIHIFGL